VLRPRRALPVAACCAEAGATTTNDPIDFDRCDFAFVLFVLDSSVGLDVMVVCDVAYVCADVMMAAVIFIADLVVGIWTIVGSVAGSYGGACGALVGLAAGDGRSPAFLPDGDQRGPDVGDGVLRREAVAVAVDVMDAVNAKLELSLMLDMSMPAAALTRRPPPLMLTCALTPSRCPCSPPLTEPTLAVVRVFAFSQWPWPLAPCSPVMGGLARLGPPGTGRPHIQGLPASRIARAGSSMGAPASAGRIVLASITP
jgi:hypothetical protein